MNGNLNKPLWDVHYCEKVFSDTVIRGLQNVSVVKGNHIYKKYTQYITETGKSLEKLMGGKLGKKKACHNCDLWTQCLCMQNKIANSLDGFRRKT